MTALSNVFADTFADGEGCVLILFGAQIAVVDSLSHLVRGTSMTQHDMAAPSAVAELVREIAQALVDEPTAVDVQSVARDENTVLKLRVAPQDVGKVIGKQGRTARSMRTILGAVSMKLHHRYTLDILEEEDE